MRSKFEAIKGSVLVLSCSLNPNSRSRRLAIAAESRLNELDVDGSLVDLRDWDLPMCDGSDCYSHNHVVEMIQKITEASAVLIASPVYNYDLNAAAKNVVELTGKAWLEKPVGFLCTAGGHNSYMSPIGLANSLMFDFRCHVIPRYVYATKEDFTNTGDVTLGVSDRIDGLVQSTLELTSALAWIRS